MMPTCEYGFDHEPPPEPVVIEDSSAEAAEAAGDAGVRIAEIEAGASIELAKIANKAIDAEAAAALAALRARVDVLEAAAAPPPAPEPVVVPMPEPEPAPEPVPAPPDNGEPKPERKRRGGYWG